MIKKLARWILKKELTELKQHIKSFDIYIDTDDSDRITFWKEILQWAESPTARKWAFREINTLLNALVKVSDKDPHRFWGIQGALEQMDRFMHLSELIEDKLKEVVEELEKKSEKEDEEESISELNK